MNIFKKIFGSKPQLTKHEKYFHRIVVVPYAGDIAPGKEKEFEAVQCEALEELENYINNEKFLICDAERDESIHAFVYRLGKVETYYE